jgi:hypothetical protein
MIVITILSFAIWALDISYVHVYAMLYTLQLLKTLNSKEAVDKSATMKMLVYWVTYIVSGVVMEWTPLHLVPGTCSIRIIGLAGLLSPKVELKDIIYRKGFNGGEPEAEKLIAKARTTVKQVVGWLKTCD